MKIFNQKDKKQRKKKRVYNTIQHNTINKEWKDTHQITDPKVECSAKHWWKEELVGKIWNTMDLFKFYFKIWMWRRESEEGFKVFYIPI